MPQLSLPHVFHLFRSSTQAVCGHPAVSISGFGMRLFRVVWSSFGLSSILRLARLTAIRSARNSLD